MAVTSHNEHWESLQGQQDMRFRRTYKRRFIVVVDDNANYSNLLFSHASTPDNGDAHPNDASAFVVNVKCYADSAFFGKWWIDVDYDSWFEEHPDYFTESPLAKPNVIEWGFEKLVKAVQYDINDDDIVNSAEVPYSPPLEIEYPISIATVTKNYAVGSVPSLRTYYGAVNSDIFTLDGTAYPVGSLKISGMTFSKKQKQNGTSFIAVSWMIAYKEDKWLPHRVLDQGFSELVADKWRTILNAAGPLPNPSRLNGSGLKLAPGDAPVYLEFALNHALAFVGNVPG